MGDMRGKGLRRIDFGSDILTASNKDTPENISDYIELKSLVQFNEANQGKLTGYLCVLFASANFFHQ